MSVEYPVKKIPEHIHPVFPGQFQDEEVIFVIRRHWSIIMNYIFRLVAAHVLAAVIFIFLTYLLQWDIPIEGPYYVLTVMVVSTYLLGAWLFYIHEFVDYHLDLWVLTNQRIVSIEQNGLFKRTVAELNLNKVQDVTFEISGKVQTFMNFGTVFVQTASEQERFSFDQVSQPQNIARQIIDAIEKNKQKNLQMQAQVMAEQQVSLTAKMNAQNKTQPQ